MLSDNAIKEFQEIFQKEYGKELSWDDARESANNLINYMKLLCNINTKEHQRQLLLKNELVKKMLKMGLIEYTIPDKPNSRLQKYRLKKKSKALNKKELKQ